MSIWGKHVDEFVSGKPSDVGWRDDSRQGARVIALGVLMAVAVVAVVAFAIYRASQPSETECVIQRFDYSMGDRAAIDGACR